MATHEKRNQPPHEVTVWITPVRALTPTVNINWVDKSGSGDTHVIRLPLEEAENVLAKLSDAITEIRGAGK